MDAKEYNKIMERLDFIEFRQQLLFDNDDVSRSIFEYGLTREQYKRIMALMQDYRERIERGEKCGHGGFEQAMYEIVPDHRGDYHMCEELQKDSETRIDGKRFLIIYMEKCPSILI